MMTDDEEILKLLLSSSGNDNNNTQSSLTESLQGVFERLEEDFEMERGNEYWKTLTFNLKEEYTNLEYSCSSLERGASATSSTSNATKVSETDVTALSKLLKIPKVRTTQLLASSSSSSSSCEKEKLFINATMTHFQQRWARLLILTECLRIEQDPQAPLAASVQTLLDQLDSSFSNNNNNKRGIFRRLLSIACMPDRTPTRDELEPAKKLIQKQDAAASFASLVLQEVLLQAKRERVQAMEALVVLLYYRTAMTRLDYAVMIKAFSDIYFFSNTQLYDERCIKLAGLVCAESMGLWRAFEETMNDWEMKHPFLVNLDTSGMEQLESLKRMLSDSVQQVNRPKYFKQESPEALAFLSFGLLLCLTSESSSSSSQLKTLGTEIVSIANDQAGAFDYLFVLMEYLTASVSASLSANTVSNAQFYDWQLSNDKEPLAIANQATTAADADAVVYTSIAREVLASAISAFSSTILSISHPNACDNIGLLCNLAAVVYQSNPLLAEEFWVGWQSFISAEPSTINDKLLPVCSLMDAAHSLANTALLQATNVSGEVLLPAVAPFVKLLSSLCHDAEIIETAMDPLQETGMLRTALLACRLPVTVTGSDSYNKSRIILLQAIAKLAHVASSSHGALEKLRWSLEMNSAKTVDGPRVLGRILSSTRESAIANPTLEIMACLLNGAPQEWALELAKQSITTTSYGQQQHLSILNSFLSPDSSSSSHAAALVLAELIEHLTTIVFSHKLQETDTVEFLHVVAQGVLSAGTALSPSLLNKTSLSVSFETPRTILELFANFLKLIRTVIELHQSPQVSAAAVQVRDSLINTLASSVGLGQAIAYYASAPVSLSLSIQLSDALANGQLAKQDESSSQEQQKKFGVWQSVLSKPSGLSSVEHRGKKLLVESAASIGVADFDLEGMQEKGWTGCQHNNQLAPLNAAFSAIRLLSLWAQHVEDIVKTHVEDGVVTSLDDPVKELISQLSPQRLLSSLASIPMPCRSDSRLVSVWEAAGLSNFELLLPYLSLGSSTVSSAIPSSLTLDLLHTCLVHVRYSCPAVETVADTMLFRVVYRSARFSNLLIESVEKAVALSTKRGMDRQEKTEITNGLLSLRLLCTCVKASPAVADKMLQLESKNPIVPTLLKVASKAKDLLDIEQSSQMEIFKTDESIIQMRLATGAVSVLSSLWMTARTTRPGQTSSVGLRMVNIVDDQTAFISDLMTIVMGYANANDIESKIVPSIESEYARCTLTTFMSKALDILATEVAYFVCNGDKNTNVTLENLLLKSFFQPQRFTSFNGYKYAAESTVKFASMEMNTVGNLKQPINLLRCFPSTSSSHLSQDFYTRENSFDVGSSAQWLADSTGKDLEELEDIMARVSIAYQLASCDLKMIASWKGFAEVLVYFSVEHARRTGQKDSGPSAERLLNLAQDTLRALHFNIEAINQAQVEVAEDFMRGKSSRMAEFLTDLFLFFLEMGSQNEESSKLLDCDELLDLLDLLTKTSEMLFTVISSLPADATTTKDLETCCTLEKPLLASAILIHSLIESKSSSLSGPQKGREKGIYNSLCRVGSKVLNVLGQVIKQSNKEHNTREETKQDNRESLCCCISLFTVLVAKGQGSQISDASYFKLISENLRENGVLKQLIDHGLAASTAAATAISTQQVGVHAQQDYGKRGPSQGEMADLIVVQSVLNLLYSVSEANNPEMLSIFVGTQLAQLVARNPLYKYTNLMWTQNDASAMPPRGYVVSEESAGFTFQQGPMAAASFRLGKTDPVHTIWLTSMKILQASLRSSTNCLSIQGTESIGKLFIGMSAQFVAIHRAPLITCLKYCSSKLTQNALLEATHILALVAELYKRDTRDIFLHQHQHGQVCEELVDWSKFVVVSISKFLGAAGTARELFRGLEEFEFLDQNFDENRNVGASGSKASHPLLSKRRLQDAKHEAYKFSDYAARCCQRVTKSDFQAASTVPAHLKHLSIDRKNDEPLEKNCRLSVTSEFNLQMERAASDCLFQAISTIWKTHPCSRSFKMFSEGEARRLDAMSLVQPGMIIGFRPAGGESILADGSPASFDNLRFGRVCSSDTVNCTWTVTVLGRSVGESVDPDTREVVRVRQLAGIEDISSRKAVAVYFPAPDTMDALEKGCSSLSLGHLVLALRWCHQRSSSLRESNLVDGPTKIKSTARIAEQTVALLGAELAIHAEIGSALNMEKVITSQLDSQIYELFADSDTLRHVMDSNTAVQIREGRLKSVISPSAWNAARPQTCRHIERTWNLIKDKELSRQKRAYDGDTNWFSGGLRSKGYKSAFRG